MMAEYTVLTTLAFHHLLIGSVLIIVLWLFNRFVPSTAELRSWLWMTVFIVSTVVPFSLISTENQKVTTTIISKETSVTLMRGEQPVVNAPGLLEPAEQHWHLPIDLVFSFSYFLTLALFVWALGSIWRASRTLTKMLRTRQLTKAALHKVPSLSHYIGVNVFTSTKVSSPLVIGFFNVKIILPESIAEQLPEPQLKAILLHEYAHIQRKDNWFALFQELLAILFWWSLVIRILNKTIHVEREIACDLRAAAKLESGKQYAQSLLDCAKLMVHQQRNMLAMGLFSKKKELSHRIGEVLQNTSVKRPHAILTALLCIGLSISTVKATQSFAPKINIEHTLADARHYSLLPNEEGTLLIRAVARNDIETIKALQNEGIDINTPAIGDGTALMIAVASNNTTMVEALLSLGADVNQSSEGDGNPLIVAAMRNNVELAELLLDNGAEIDAIVPRDETALINASRFGYLDMVRLLINRGADVNLAVTTGFSDGFKVRSPLKLATNT
jgi:bla regulator protein BlaR1